LYRSCRAGLTLHGECHRRRATATLFQHGCVQAGALRGACVAFRHTGRRRLASTLTLAHSARAVTGDVTEDAAKGTQAAPSGLRGDFGHRQIGITQQRHRSFDAAAEQITVRRQPEGLLERAGEVRRRHRTDLSQARDGPFLMAGPIHPVLGAQQAPQQFGALTHGITARAR